MTDELARLPARPLPTAERPLLGLTVLLVEDSRYASEAMRLMCLRSGARLRRADCLHSARRHLGAYRPDVAIVDLGLPDGPGTALIAELALSEPRVTAIIATSGDTGRAPEAAAAGAAGFLAKPVESLGQFQETVLSALPAALRPRGPRRVPQDTILPDPAALRDDLAHAAEVIALPASGETIDYLAQFLGGIALAAHDVALARAAQALAQGRAAGADGRADLTRLGGIVAERLAGAPAL